jgi:thiamine transport system substrate-binding protein
VGIPDFCNECELAQKFVQFILQPESQKIIMNKNYMYPAINNVADNTPFANLHSLNIQTKFDQIPAATIDQWLKRWSEVRKKVSDK